MILSGRMIHAACITFIFFAEKALRITALLSSLGCSNGFRVFLRLAQINRDVDITVLGRSNPFDVLSYTVSSYIIRILA